MPDNRYYYFKDAKGNRHTVNKAAFDNDREGFAKAFPGARMEVIDRKTGRRGDVDVKDAGRVGDFGAHLFTGQTVKREKYQPKTSLGKAAQSVAQEKWGGYGGAMTPMQNDSELVRGLKNADAAQRLQAPVSYTKPGAVKQMVKQTRERQHVVGQNVEQAGRQFTNRERDRRNAPAFDLGNEDVNNNLVKTRGQLEKDMEKSGTKLVDDEFSKYISDVFKKEDEAAFERGQNAALNIIASSPSNAVFNTTRARNEEMSPEKRLSNITNEIESNIHNLFSSPKTAERINAEAARLGVSPDEYIEHTLVPSLMNKVSSDFDKTELKSLLPSGAIETILMHTQNSMTGALASMGLMTKSQRQYGQRALSETLEGNNPKYNPGLGTRVAGSTLSFMMDMAPIGMAEKPAAAVAGKVFGNGVAQTARIANASLGGRIARMAGSGMVSQGITGVLYGSTNAAVQNYSTGDDTSIGNTVKVMAMGGLSEGASWATMGGIGGAVGAGIYNVSGVKRIPAKAFQLAMEGIGMHMGGNVAKTIEGHDTDWTSIEGNLEACANVVALKLTHARLPKRQSKDGVKESYLDMVARNINGLMTSDGQRAAFGGYTFTNEEKEQLFGSASAPKRNESIYGYDVHDNPLTRKESLTSWAMRAKKTAAKGKGEESYKDKDAEFVKTAYDEIMADNTIPWDTKAKFSALVMGTVPSERPMMENCRIEGNSVNEYSKNGELLSKNSFKSIDERNSIIYSLNMKREDQRLSNAYGAAQIKDEKTAQATLEAVAEANGMTAEQLKAAMDKQPLRRSDEEQNACVALRKAYEDEQFVPGTLHAEQSNTEGKDVVEENGLGTETPNNEAVAEVLGDLTKAEDALQTAMDGNDVLKEEYERMQKAGMSNPQIYMELFNSGLTQEQLAPLADYINALSKAQGMFKGTQDKIVETTQKHVGQWSYKDELNGEKQNGEQMLFVKDNKGRVLIVGAGDVAFDNDGRARESVGDMLSVLDPTTMEMDFVSKKDVQLDHVEKTEDYAKNYQTMLEVKNSEVYAAMQQDGKPNEASLSQTKPGEEPKGEAPKPEVEETKHSYSLGEKKAGNGESFYQDENGNIDLVTIPDEIFEGIGYTKAPFRLTPSMIKHMLDRHNKELGFKDEREAINFVVDVMNNFDHVRLGYDGALVFSIENGRKRTGKRAVTVLINSDNGEFYGLKTSGYEGIKGLEKRPLLWERGANETSSTDAASASVTTGKSPISGEQSGSASHQGNGLQDKDSNNSANGNGNNETLTFADGTPVPMMKDSKGRETADYSQMSPEQGAEWMSSQFGENAEAAVDGQIKRAEKTLKDAEKIKVDYTGDLNDAKEAEAQKTMAVDAAKKELELYTNIKKAMTEKKVKAGMERVSSVGGVGEVGSVGVAREKFESGLRVVGNKRTRTLADGSKLRGHYEIVDADSLTPSHNANDGYKKSEGFPVNEEGRTINDRDYENDKQAQLVTDMIAMKYDGQAVDQVPVVTSDGIVVDGNGRTMAGQKAAKDGTDGAYLEALKENAENYGFTAEQIEQSGIKHPRLVLVSDEPMKYDTATFAKFNKNEKKAQGNTQQAVANSKKLSTDEIGTIISEIEGSGSLDAFFNNPSAINSLLTRLVDKGVIGLNEVAGLREGEDKLSAAGKDFVKNLLLGSVFSENTIRMMGADAMLKTKALNGIRAVTDNMKLGDYALMKEIDQAVQLLYEARQGGSGVDAYLRTPAMFGENAADRFDPISQAIALALEGKAEDFRELMMAYNRNAAPYADASQTEMFGERPTKEDFVNEFLKLRNWKDYETRHSSKEGNGDAGSSEGTEPQARGGSVITSEADYDKAVEHLKEAKGEERERILDQMGEYVKEFAKSNGYDEPVVLRTKQDLTDAAKTENDKTIIENMSEGAHYPGYYEDGKIHIYLEGSTGSEELRETFEHESVHADNDTDPSRVESLVYSITDMNTLTRRDLESVIEKLVHDTHYTDEARKLPEDEALHMLADEVLAHLVEYAQKNGIRAISEITNNPTLLNVAEKAFKERENDRRRKEGLAKSGDKTLERKNLDDVSTEENGRALEGDKEGKPENDNGGSHDRDIQAGEEQREVDKAQRTNTTRDPLVETTKATFEQSKAEYLKALKEGKTGKELENAELHYKFSFLDYQNVMGVTDAESLEKLWKREFESAKTSETEPSEASLGLTEPGEQPGEKSEGAKPVGDGKEPKANPLDGMRKAAELFKDEQITKARAELAEAKKSGDASEVKRLTDKLKGLMDSTLRGKGIGLVERRKIIGEELGKAEAEKIDKPWADMEFDEQVAETEKKPLDADEIKNSDCDGVDKANAVAYLNGDKNIIITLSYLTVYDNVRNRERDSVPSSGTEDGTQLDAADNAGGEGLGRTDSRPQGVDSGQLGRTEGDGNPERGESVQSGERVSGGESGKVHATAAVGEQGGEQVHGGASGVEPVSAGGAKPRGSRGVRGEGRDVRERGNEGSGNFSDEKAGEATGGRGIDSRNLSTVEQIDKEISDTQSLVDDLFNSLFDGRTKGSIISDRTNASIIPLASDHLLGKLGINKQKMAVYKQLIPALTKLGYLHIKKGVVKLNDWIDAMKGSFGGHLTKLGLSDEEVYDYIKNMWNSNIEVDGVTHKLSEWASILGTERMKKEIATPNAEKYKRQVAAEPIKVKVGDMKNIEETLPFLLPQQHEDVLKAETQFFGNEHADREHAYGKGYMFTNGTGTGKTFTGLGIAKRLVKQGKGRILIVTPSQKKVSDWIKDGHNLNMEIRDLDNWAKERGTTATTESGEGVVITTFANFGVNKKLLETKWDAVIYDESHRIMENKNGTETARSMQHYMVTNRSENHCFLRLQEINKDYQKQKSLGEQFDIERAKETERIRKEYKASHPSATERDVAYATSRMVPRDVYNFTPSDYVTFPVLGKIHAEYVKALSHYTNEVKPKLEAQAKAEWKDTKTIFLSATPFNTRENLDYAEGYIFKYPEEEKGGRMSGRTQFYLDHFGAAYKFRYGRLEQSTSNPEAVAKQEIAFSDYLQDTLGTMSGRIIDSPYDYSRDFPTVSPDHAETFNQAVQEAVRGHEVLAKAYNQTIGDYNYGSALFETMKVANIIERIKAHLDAGRKVVIFHRRVETKEPLKPPFASMLEQANRSIALMKPGEEQKKAIQAVKDFRKKYADLLEWEQTLDYSMPREQIAKVFGKDKVLFFSGKESTKVKDKAVDTFNDDDSGKNIIVIQEASGKEGISLHDKTGKHQRVCITLALPQSPITALQIEGRTYRIGNKSNAIFEYPILGLNSEMMLFGQKFNNQVSTTENLALGSQARNLRDSFANGILEHSGVVPIDQQGVGGKEFDAPKDQSTDGFDNAVLDYYSNQKLNSRNREGVDYFPTPEPLGYKMMEWANMGEGDTVLEPSAGHGAIARYAPKGNQMVAIEPSQSLFTKLQLKAGGLGRKFQNTIFENYDISNKHDVVVMNPPFGTAGATAIAHLGKAFKHLEEGGRVVALIPRGSTDKKFEKWIEGEKTAVMRAEVALPDIVFEKAGTKVVCRVVVVDKISNEAMRAKAGSVEKWDLGGHYDKIEDFFEDLRDVEMPDRIIDTNAIMMKKSKQTVKDLKELKGARVDFNEGGINVRVRGDWKDYSIPFDMEGYSPEQKKKFLASTYETFEQQERQTRNETSQAVLAELKKLTCKLAGMTEEEMQRYLKKKYEGKGVMYRIEHAAEVYNKANQHYRMELGNTFSDSKEHFDAVRDRAVEEKGIVMPNLNKEKVKVVEVEKHLFGENKADAIKNARTWAKDNLATKNGDMPTMRDGTPYIISKAAIDKYLSNSAISKSEDPFVHLSVLTKLTDVIHESIETEIHPDYKKGEDGMRSVENGYGEGVLVHRLYGAVELDGKTYRVKTTMQEFRGGEENKPHSYEVTKIELLDSPGKRENPDRPPLVSSNNSKNITSEGSEKANESDSLPLNSATNGYISTAKLLQGVGKSYDSGKKLLDESKDLTDGETLFRKEEDKSGYASLGLSKPTEPLGEREAASSVSERIGKAIDKAAERTGGKVKMVNTVEEIGNEQVRRDIENGKQVTGWYDENTGEVRLYMPNIHDSYTAEKTVWHETVGHKGMRGLLGDKFKDYMRGLWLDLDNPVNAELRAYVKERMGKDSMGFYDAIEEFIAESAEKGKGEPGFWNYIKNKVTDALHEIGYRISPNVKDVKYMLWLAKNVQKKGDDPWWKMRADAVKWKIEHENVEYTKIHGGEFYENDGKSHDFEDMSREEWDEATDGQIHYRTAPSAATALDRYHKMLDAHGYMATEAFMDNMLSLDKLMRAVDPSIKKIEDVKSSMNPYILQNTMQGAMSDKMTLFEHQVMKPLDKAMSDVLDSFDGKNTEEKIRECNLYMIGKHGLERNRVLFVRDYIRGLEPSDAESLQRQWNAEKKDLGDKLRNGDIDLKEYYESMDEWIRNNVDMDFKAEEHDYSGMHGLQEIDDLKSPYDDAGAIDSVMSQEAKMENQKKGSVDNLWKRIKDATDYSIDSDYENGLMDKTRHDRVKNMFDWYVPLRKYDEATAEDVYGYISGDNGKGFIGETLMNAKGRKSLSDVNVLAQIGAMGNRAIRNGGQNAVKQAFARFVRNSGEQNLVKETKVWVEKKGTDMNGNDIWEEAYPQIPDNASAHDIATIVDAFETDMKTKQAKGEAKTLSNSTDIGFKFARAKNKSEHFVDVKIAGRTHRFVVLGNPRAAQALNGMLENSSPNSALLKGLKSTTRFMAQMATSYSPEFVMRNIIRDAEFASSNVTAKEGVMYGKKWLRYYAELNPLNVAYNEGAGALKSLKWKDLKEGVGMGLYARYREGTLGNSKMERYFKEFMENGGETGWVQVKTMQEWEKDYKRDVSREHIKVAKTGKALRDFLVGNVENLNEVAENMARFATFCTSRDLGRSAVRSAYDAKQVSTNFNRHGSGDAIKTFKNGEMGTSKEMRRNVYGTIASYLRNYSMFFNAGVQSTHLLMNNVKKAPVGTVASMMAMPFGLGIMAAVVNNAMIASEDEKKRKGVKDPYGELPEYIRRNNLCIYKGGGEFVTIPLAIELRAFYGLGDIAAGMTAAKNVKSTRNAAMDAVGCMSQLLPVVDFMNSATFDKEPGKELLKGVLPTAAPLVEWWLNSDWKGTPIRREGDYTENRPAWMNAYSGTPEKLMDLNKWVNAKTNDVAPGNENMKGDDAADFITNPAMLNHFIGTLGGGAATFITRGTGLVLKYADGREQEIETKDIPFLRSLMYTPSEQTSMARTKAKWYGYKESMEKSTSNYSMLKNKNVPLTERIRNAADRHRFEQKPDYARIRIIKDAEKQMKRWNKMKRLNADDKKQVDFANKNIEMIMQKAVEQMDRIED